MAGRKYTVDIYHPIKGWAAVLYGPDGPEYTGGGHPSPYGAIEDAKEIARFEHLPYTPPVVIRCPVCGGWKIDGCCDECRSRELYEKIAARRARRKA